MSQKVRLQRYTDFERAQDDQELLVKAGLTAAVHEEIDDDSESGAIYYLQVPKDQSHRAYDVLNEYYESERDQSFDLLGDLPGDEPPHKER